ncbi:ABC transporter permease subunit [Promicromonospora panici]|uniref:ABC transporter permease subunit n=1 Tax=Promicromonospora panici TaxID=2219658 RepID=UPI00101CB550|nr:ABC transporter permease subunit [Promicromonospora panici]
MNRRSTATPIRPVLVGALASEAVKLWTLRSNQVLSAVALLVISGTGVLLSFSLLSRTTDARFAGRTVTAEPMQFVDSVLWAQVVVAVLAVLAVTGEYTSGQARLSLLALPTRSPWLAAKALVLAALGFLIGVIGAAISLGLSVLILTGSEVVYEPVLGESVSLALRSGAYLAAVAVLAMGVASALRHVVAALTAVLGLLVVAPLLLSSMPGVREAADYTPTYAGRRLISEFPSAAQLEPWAGFGVLVAWAAVALVIALVALRARDA